MTSDAMATLHSQAEPKRPAAVTEAQALYLKHNPTCAVCGSIESTQAHHIIPYEYLCKIDREWLAKDQRIFVGLCETEKDKPEPNHHIAAHGFDFKHVDLHFFDKVEEYKKYKTFAEIKAAPVYHETLLTRLKLANEMTDEDIKTLQAYVDGKWPKVDSA
jgi:hypothetical protein